MRSSSRAVRQSALLLTLSVLLTGTVRALDFEYVRIADTSTAIPTAGGTFTAFSAPVISGYTVVFQGNNGGYTGIFTSSGGFLTRTVDTTTLVPGAGTSFTSFAGFSVDNGQVAFTGSGSGVQGIYLTNPTGFTKVVDLTTAIPGGSGNFTSFSAPSLSNGQVAFVGNGAAQQGVYSTESGLHVVANTNTAIPSGSGNFAVGEFASASLSYADVAFRGGNAGALQGIYDTSGGTLHRIADTTTALPEGGGSFSGFTGVSTRFGIDAFANGNPTRLGIYTSNGGTTNLVANTSTAIPNGAGNFTSFGAPSTWGWDTAFVGGGSGGQTGLYTTWGGSLSTVINNSSILDGKTVTAISTGAQAIHDGTFVFNATFSDGSSGVYVAQQSYQWGTNTSGTWDAPGNWSFGSKPRTALTTSIHPEYGATITGPSAPTTIRNLNIHARNSGVAELRLQPSGPLTVNEFINVNERGRISIAGGSLVANYGLYNYGGYVDIGGGQFSGGNLANYDSGTVVASGTIGSHLENWAFVQVLNTSARFTEDVDNYEQFQIVSSVAQFENDVYNHDNGGTGRFNVRDSILQFSDFFQNSGIFNVSFGTTDIFGNVTNDLGGDFILSGNSNTSFYDQLIHDGDTFRVSTGSTAVFFGLVSGTGSFTGGGEKIFEGGFSPGASPAIVSLDGPVTFMPANTLYIELGGPNPGTGYDHVNVSGHLSLDGSLQVSLIDGYVPDVGSTFNVLEWSSVSGSFASTPTTTQQGILRLFWDVTQTPTHVDLTLTRAYYDVQSGGYPQNLIGNGVELVKSTSALATITGNNSYTGPTTIAAGTLQIGNGGTTGNLGSGAIINNSHLQFNRSDALAVAAPISGAGTVTQAGTGTTTLSNYQGTGAISINAGTLAIGTGSGIVKTPSLTIVAGTTLDLKNNSLLVQGSPGLGTWNGSIYSGALAQVQSGAGTAPFSGGLPTWTGTGITSATAAATTSNGLAITDGATYQMLLGNDGDHSTFGGTVVNNTDVIVKYTWNGDANLDGVIDFWDYIQIDSGVQDQFNVGFPMNYASGDFNLDGTIDFWDYIMIDAAFQDQTGPLSGGSLIPAGGSTGGDSAAVPEPASLMLLGLGAVGMLMRRRAGR